MDELMERQRKWNRDKISITKEQNRKEYQVGCNSVRRRHNNGKDHEKSPSTSVTSFSLKPIAILSRSISLILPSLTILRDFQIGLCVRQVFAIIAT